MSTSNHTQLEDFSQFYFSLSKTQKEIWRYLHWFCSTYDTVQPSHARIAEKVGCTRRTVVRAIKHFVKAGWLVTTKGKRKTHAYAVENWLRDVDLTKLKKVDDAFIEKEGSPCQ